MTSIAHPPLIRLSGRSPALPRPRPAFSAVVLAIGVVGLFLLPSLLVPPGGAWPAIGRSPGISAGSHATPVRPGAAEPAAVGAVASAGFVSARPTAAPPPSNPAASGRGTFFTNTLIPPAAANQSCLSYYGSHYCVNITNDPSLNLTSSGVLGVAYTAFVNAAICGAATNNTTTMVGFQRSGNFGTTWSAPTYLGNTNCTSPAHFASAMDPSLTSLANGTMVLTYIQYSNYSYYSYYENFAPYLEPQFTNYDRLVVQESYNGGLAWTSPRVLDWSNNTHAGYYNSPAGRPAYRDWVTATGNTVYVTWENLTDPDYQNVSGYFSSQIHLRVSTDGGATWGKTIDLPVTPGKYGGYGVFRPTDYAVNPTVLAAPNGEVFVAYSTGWTYDYSRQYCAPYPPYACGYGVYTDDIVVANSSTNGSTWSVHMAAANVSTSEYFNFRPSGIFHDPSPVLAYSATRHQVYLAYAGTVVGDFCNPASTSGCQLGVSTQDIYVQNSSDGGARWSAPAFLSSLVNVQNGTENSAYQPAIGVDANGTLHLVATWNDYSKCVAITSSYSVCGQVTKVYLNSTDNGTTFSEPLIVNYGGSIEPNEYDGEYSSLVSTGSRLVFAWSDPSCPTAAGCGYPFAATGASTVTISEPFTGAGVTLSFTETNLSAGLRWSADVLGNLRSGLAGSTLSVLGVPTGQPIAWSVGWVNLSSGISFEPTVTPASPGTLTANTAVAAKYSEFALLDVRSVPTWPYSYYTQSADWNVSPTLGPHWVPVNSTQQLWANYTPVSCATGCYYANLSFQSWTGSGVGSQSTNHTSITLKMRSGVTETANFLYIGHCNGYVTFACVNLTGYSLGFLERGLPTGTTWSVTVDGKSTGSSAGSAIGFSVAVAPVTYTVWSVPAKGGKLWVPTEDASSPVQVPSTSRVDVTYTLESPALATFDLNLTEAGLPNGTTWSAQVGGTGYSVGPQGLDLLLPGGSTVPVNGSFVYTTGGVGYYATNVTFNRFVENTTGAKTVNVPANVPVNGSLTAVVHYAPMYWLTVTGTPGGRVTPSSHWVVAGAPVNLTAVAGAGYYFLTWSGTGQGASSGSQNLLPNITIHVGGPITEAAEFLQVPPVTWNVTVVAGGLPNGTSFGVTFGGTSYAGFGSLVIPRLLTGDYPVSWPDVYLNATETTRFAASSVDSTLAPLPSGFRVASNGTIWVNYSTQYSLTITSTPNGVTTPSPGVYWEPAGATVGLSAAPSHHYRFVGWNGTGAGHFAGASPTGTVTMSGPVTEAAQFVWRVFPPPAVYWVKFNESGLPAGTPWEVSAGSTGASGSGTSLTVSGLNGSYPLVVPPVYVGSGTRFVLEPDLGGAFNVTANGSVDLVFTEEFLVTVVVGQGGTTSVATGWEAAGTPITLGATAQSGWRFESWNGTGTASYSGTSASTSLTLTGPITESASFAPIYAAPHASASTAGQPLALGLLAVGLLIGLAVAVLVARRGRPSVASDASESPGADGPSATDEYQPEEPASETQGEPAPEYSPEPSPGYSPEGEEPPGPEAYQLPPSYEPAPYDEGPP